MKKQNMSNKEYNAIKEIEKDLYLVKNLNKTKISIPDVLKIVYFNFKEFIRHIKAKAIVTLPMDISITAFLEEIDKLSGLKNEN